MTWETTVVNGTLPVVHVTRVGQQSESVVGTRSSCEADLVLELCFWTTFSGTKRGARDSRRPMSVLDSDKSAKSRRARRKHSRLVGVETVGLNI